MLDVKPFEPQLDVPGYTRGSGWLDHVRAGWYSQPAAATNPLVRPGREGLRAAGLDLPVDSPTPPATDARQGGPMKLSARNQLRGTVRGVDLGAVMAEVTVDVDGQQVVSAITRASAERLGLAEGQPVTVIVKATEVMLGVDEGLTGGRAGTTPATDGPVTGSTANPPAARWSSSASGTAGGSWPGVP